MVLRVRMQGVGGCCLFSRVSLGSLRPWLLTPPQPPVSKRPPEKQKKGDPGANESMRGVRQQSLVAASLPAVAGTTPRPRWNSMHIPFTDMLYHSGVLTAVAVAALAAATVLLLLGDVHAHLFMDMAAVTTLITTQCMD